jgi:hypothetical protein
MQTGGVPGSEHRDQGRRAGVGRGDRRELAKIDHSEVRVNVIHTGVGGITENDVNLAAASNAMVVGFNVRPSARGAPSLAERQGIEIRQYRVIYELTREIEQALVGMLSPVETEAVIGEVEVRALFRVSRLGTIAGCMVTSGVVRRGANVRIFREGTRIHETTVAQLKRFKDDAREVARASSAASCSRASTTSARATSSRSTRRARSSARRSTTPARARRPRGRRVLSAPASSRSSRRAALPRGRLAEGQAQARASAKAQLQNRFGASVAEVDHHELWQRAALTAAFVAARRAADDLAARASAGCRAGVGLVRPARRSSRPTNLSTRA